MKHNIHIGFEQDKGVIIENLDCPYEPIVQELQELMKKQKFIDFNKYGVYSIHPVVPQRQAEDLVYDVMKILFKAPIHTCSETLQSDVRKEDV